MVGQTISHYRITEKLGEGGMGVVYKAEDTNLKRPVALKFLAAHLLGDEDVKARFRREAEAAAALNHPNICHVYEISETEGKTFIAMAFLEGEGLDKKIEAGPLKLKDALQIAIQTAHGLQAAHEKKIVHRDIKPANLMVTGEGSKQLVTIMDFGLAQLADRSKLTRTDETMGTVTYMSPEQTYGMDLDHRTDIWSLGVVLYELATGQQPFKGHYDKAVMYSITNEEPEPMTGLRTGVPMELEWVVGKCLAKDVDERYQSTAELVVDLETLRKKLESGTGFDASAFLATEFQESIPRLSPDGRFVAYISDESGRQEIYVQSFPEGGSKWPVSANGGVQPLWSKDGKELFYVQDDTLMAAPVTAGPEGFATGTASPLFGHDGLVGDFSTNYDVSADGRFVVVATAESEGDRQPTLCVVQNWYEEFRDREQD